MNQKNVISKSQHKPYNLYFSVLQFVNIAAGVSIQVFLVVFLSEKGYSSLEIGGFVSLVNLVGIFGQPFLGYLVDKHRSYKKLVSIAIIIGICIQLSMPSAAENRIMLTILLIGYALSFRSVGPIIDSWTITAFRKNPSINYGLARGFGSIGSSAASIVVGRLVMVLGINSIFYSFAFFASISVITAFLIGDDSVEYTTVPKKSFPTQTGNGVLKTLLKQRTFIILELTILLAFIAYWPTTATYFPILMLEYGGTSGHIGIAQAIMSMSEVPFLFMSKRLIYRFGEKKLIFFGFVMLIFRIFLHIPSVYSPILLTIVPVLQGVSFGILFPAILTYISSIVDESARTTAITLNAVIMFNVSAIIGNFIGGYMADIFGTISIYWAGTLLMICASALVFFTMITSKGNAK